MDFKVLDVIKRKNKEKVQDIMFILFVIIWILAGIGVILSFPSV